MFIKVILVLFLLIDIILSFRLETFLRWYREFEEEEKKRQLDEYYEKYGKEWEKEYGDVLEG